MKNVAILYDEEPFNLYYDALSHDIVDFKNENTIELGEVLALNFYDALAAIYVRLEKIQRRMDFEGKYSNGVVNNALSAIRINYPETIL